MEEPSVLDYFKQKINPRNWGKKLDDFLPEPEEEEVSPEPIEIEEKNLPPKTSIYFPWQIILALLFALAAQRMLEPTSRNLWAAVLLYAVSLGMILLAFFKHEWLIGDLNPELAGTIEMNVRSVPFFIFLPVTLLAFYALKDNQFTGVNLFLWIAAILLLVGAFWQPEKKIDLHLLLNKVKTYICKPFLNIHFSAWNLLVIAVFLLAAFFHLSQLSTVPLDMTSDHAEKILDINRILNNGVYPFFFSNNGGREPIEFYMVAAFVKWFGAALNFTTLKFSMALAFLVGLFFVYKLGKELGNKWTGLIAMLFMGFASWTNIIARVGMRLVLCPVFVAPVLYYLLRGLRCKNRNNFILAGIFLGLGVMGYSAFRIMPLVVFLGVVIYVLHQKGKLERKEGWLALGVIALFSFVLAFPLIHYALQYPDQFNYRTLTRMTSKEVPLSSNLIGVFFSNTWNAITMPFWNDGTTWVNSVTERPALDVVTAALYFIGLVVVIIRWIQKRNWQDLFMLLAIPALMLPSILALAFPIENPTLSRAGGAIVPIIMIVAIGFQSLLQSLWRKCSSLSGKVLVVLLTLVLVFLSCRQNYDLVFNQYNTAYANATWNTKQIGDVCKGYIDSEGEPDTCYIVSVPYWVDTRLVSMIAGYPTLDNAIWPDDISKTTDDPRGKMFIVRSDDKDTMEILKKLYPAGFSKEHISSIAGRSFIAYQVPPTSTK
jgi:4-amino-4-deoxy-L-arabinose transferase-like glycosyltransferase